jgi:hypothetical protein
MLDYLQAFSLLALIVTHFFLVRGCFSIKEELPLQGGMLATRIDRTADLLDEVAQLIADLSDGASPPAVAQPPSGLGEMVAMFLNNRMNSAENHAPQSEEWEVQFPNDNPPPTNEA